MFTFDEQSHTYYLDGVKIPSVTEIISPLYDFSGVNPDRLEKAAQYGKAVHKLVELYLKGRLDYNSVSPELKTIDLSYFDKFRMYMTEYKAYCSRFAGTIDLYLPTNAIIDLKTRKYHPATDDLQLYAYEMLAGGKLDKFIIELLPNKEPKMIKVVNRQAKNMFLYMLNHYENEKDFKLKLEGWKNAK